MKNRIFLSLMLVICYVLSGTAKPNIKPLYANKSSLRKTDISMNNALSKTNILSLSISNQVNDKNNWLNNLTYSQKLFSLMRSFFADEKIVYAEYFIDKDPGFGKGTSLPITTSTSISNHNFTVSLPATVSEGFHFITIRYKDALGRWSVSAVRPFYKDKIEQSSSTLSNIVYAEYFIDKDPGFGKGSSIALTSGTEISNHSFAAVLPTTLEDGFHFITIRYKDALGRWGVSSVRPFYKDKTTQGTALSNIVYVEYFIDKDPGFGKGKAITIKGSQTLENLNFGVNLNALGLPLGNHFIQLRVKDANGTWGTVATKTFLLTNEIVKISGNFFSFCDQKTKDITYEIEGTFIAGNKFTVELSEQDGTFSNTPKELGSVISNKSGIIKATLPNIQGDSYKIRIVSTNPVRVSNPISIVLKPTTPTTTVTNSVICAGSSVALSAYGCNNGIVSWTGSLIGSSVTITPSKTSSYKALCTINGCKSDSSMAVTINVNPKPSTPVAKSDNSSVCLGASAVLSATGCSGTITWSGGLTGSSVTVTPNKTTSYKALCTINGCKSDSSTAVTITVNPKPTTPVAKSNNSSVCLGTSAILSSTGCAGTVIWTGNLTGSSVTVTPNKTTSYKALCTVNGCKSDSSTAVTITVNPKPNAPLLIANPKASKVVAKWNKTFGGIGTDEQPIIIKTPDGGYLIGGSSNSNKGGDKSENSRGGFDFWVIKIDNNGMKEWDKTFGGSLEERLYSILVTSDNKYLLVGHSNSYANGDKVENSRGGFDFWLVKIDEKGQKIWDKTIGGTEHETMPTIISTIDGGYLIGGNTTSYTVGGDKTSRGLALVDYWVVKINNNGQKLWDRTFGGNKYDELKVILPTPDDGYLLGGISNSTVPFAQGGDKSENSKGEYDFWIVKITRDGQKIWDRTIGGNSFDILETMLYTPDGSILLGGYSGSSISGDKTEFVGGYDYWLVKLDNKGKMLWNRTFGGAMDDILKAVCISPDGGYLLGGYSASSKGMDKSEGNKGVGVTEDYWIVKVNETGKKIFDKTFGGNSRDYLSSMTSAHDGNFLMVGNSVSLKGEDKEENIRGDNDYWIVQVNEIVESPASITATGCSGNINWSNGETANSITVNPSTSTTYTATCTVNGCISGISNAITVNVSKPFVPTILASSNTVCAGTPTTLTASGCVGTNSILKWTGGLTGSSISVAPIKSTAYKAVCVQNGISSDSSTAVMITVNPKPATPVTKSNNSSVCLGASAVLSATGCAGTVTWTGNLTGSSVTVMPSKTSTYKALCTVNSCKSDSSSAVTITVTPKPATPIAQSNNASVCLGTSAVLSATGCAGTVSWTGNLTGSSVTVTPSKTSTYKALCTVNGCQSDSSTAVIITVTPKPATPVAKSNNSSICQGTSAVLTATGCTGAVSWTGGLTGSSVTVTPSKTSTYKALCTVNGCKSDSSTAVTVTVTPKPTTPVAKSNNSSICQGTSAVLTATGCTGTVSWTGNLTGSSVTVTPSKTSTYKAFCTVNGCKSDSSTAVTITVNPKPTTPVAKSNNSSICQGTSAVLTSTGCTGIVSWTGNLTGSSVTVTPTKTSTYKALCTVNGCKSDSSVAVTITVNPKPATPVAQSNNAIVCFGTSAVLTSTGCTGIVSWTGNLTGSSVTVTPNKTSTYKALCTVNGCKSDSSVAVTITVNPKPATPVAQSNNAIVCFGTSALLTSTGCAGTLTWTGNLTGSSVTVTPTKTSTYKALCTVNGCKSDSSVAVTITVTPKPTAPNVASNNASVCFGTSAVLTSTGCAGTVSWTGNLTGSSVTVTPSKTSSYKALCTVNGCKSDSSTAVTITVTPNPTTPVAKSNNSSICQGTSAVLTSTGCAGTVSWTGNLTGGSVTVTPSKTSTYKALCTVNGCQSDSSTAVTITVTPKPATPTAKSNNSSVCLGTSAVLSATGCAGTVTWTGNLTGSSVTVTPSKTSTYKALCTVDGCKSDSSTAVTIMVTPKPTTPVAKSNNSSICQGTSAVLTATGCTGTVSWTGNLTGSSVTVTLNKTSTYKALCTVNGCKSDSSVAVTITVTPKPTVPSVSSNNSSVCFGTSAVLTATGCTGTVSWTGNLTGSSVTVTPNKTNTYKALCMVNGCKSDSSVALTITVTPKPTVPSVSSNNSSVCFGTSAVLNVTGCNGVVSWTGNLTGSSVTVTPNKTTSYKALCTVNGCKSDSSTAVTITVTPKPTTPVAKSNNSSVCQGTSAVLTATGCTGTVTWTGNLTGSSVTVTPTKTSTYKALCTVNGCKSDSSTGVTITVTPKPATPVAKSNNSSICQGTSAVLTATGCTGTVSWTGNLTGSSVTVTPNKTTYYKTLCTVNGCKSDSSTALTITVTPKPTTPVAKSNNSSICQGTSAVLTVTGCTGTVSWTGNLTGSSVTVTPSKTTSYKALCTVNGCKSDSSLATTITVALKPNVPIISAKVTKSNTVIGEWNKTFGGILNDQLTSIIPTADGGYLLGGFSESGINGDKTGLLNGESDYWVIKVSSTGNKIWDKTYGGTGSEYLKAIIETNDGGFLLCGTSNSPLSGDKSQFSKGGEDFWVVKINSNGTKIWDKTFGSDMNDFLMSISKTSDGGFLLGGTSGSNIRGDKTQVSKGFDDYWTIKIDASGNKVWDKTFGGTNNETLTSILSTPDGGFLIGGYSDSGKSGDKSDVSRGGNDYWIVKIDASGNKIWDKTFGGSEYEQLGKIIPNSNGGFILLGDSQSGIGGDKSQISQGGRDWWIVNINSDGKKLWDKTIGGSGYEIFKDVVQMVDGSLILGGDSWSDISGDKSEMPVGGTYDTDYWLVKVDATGNKIWDKTIGGNDTDRLMRIITTKDGYILGGYSRSMNSGGKSEDSKGQDDYWIVKIKETTNNVTTLTASGCTGTVTWSNGATGTSITVSPTVATTYTATCTVNGCVSSASNAINVSPSVTGNSTLPIEAAKTVREEIIQTEPSLGFKVFPNPATNEINIETDLEGESTFQLYNSIGQKVLETNFVKKTKISISDIGRGNHFYLIQNQELRSTGKILLE